MSDYTQPVCAACFYLHREFPPPTRVAGADAERCCVCGCATSAGIFVRVDPSTVPFPRGPVNPLGRS